MGLDGEVGDPSLSNNFKRKGLGHTNRCTRILKRKKRNKGKWGVTYFIYYTYCSGPPSKRPPNGVTHRLSIAEGRNRRSR